MKPDDAGLAWEILQRYADPATAEFDAVLAAAKLPDDVARALRFWQRESIQNVKQFASESLPAVFATIAAAQHDAADATRKAGALVTGPRTASAWDQPITLPDVPTSSDGTVSRLEERRRTVAARLAELG